MFQYVETERLLHAVKSEPVLSGSGGRLRVAENRFASRKYARRRCLLGLILGSYVAIAIIVVTIYSDRCRRAGNYPECSTTATNPSDNKFVDKKLEVSQATLMRFQAKLKPDEKKVLVDTLKVCTQVIESMGASYILYGTSLLGYYRHNGSMVPWDDHLEIAVVSPVDSAQFTERFMTLFLGSVKALLGTDTFDAQWWPEQRKATFYHVTMAPDHRSWPPVRLVFLELFKPLTGLPVYQTVDSITDTNTANNVAIRYTLDQRLLPFKLFFSAEKKSFEALEVFVPRNPLAVLQLTFENWTMCAISLPNNNKDEQMPCSELADFFIFSNL